jgi:radical SAM protein with 4Fe4S-binding SPASM domain
MNFKELEMSSKGILELGNFIRYWTPKAVATGLQIIGSDGLEYIEGQKRDRPWRGCPGGWVTCGITSDGKVKGCLSLPDEIVDGDLRKDDLWDIWFHQDSFNYTRHCSPDHLGPNCISCDKAVECKGGCSANSYAASGIFHNDPYCYYKISNT